MWDEMGRRSREVSTLGDCVGSTLEACLPIPCRPIGRQTFGPFPIKPEMRRMRYERNPANTGSFLLVRTYGGGFLNRRSPVRVRPGAPFSVRGFLQFSDRPRGLPLAFADPLPILRNRLGSEKAVQAGDGFRLSARQQVPVGVHCDRDARVPQPLRDRLHVSALADQQRRVSVP